MLLSAQNTFSAIFTCYILFLAVPFVYQIFCNDVAVIETCLHICLTTAMILFVFEIVQMKHNGLEYFNEMWNICDMMHFFCVISY